MSVAAWGRGEPVGRRGLGGQQGVQGGGGSRRAGGDEKCAQLRGCAGPALGPDPQVLWAEGSSGRPWVQVRGARRVLVGPQQVLCGRHPPPALGSCSILAICRQIPAFVTCTSVLLTQSQRPALLLWCLWALRGIYTKSGFLA